MRGMRGSQMRGSQIMSSDFTASVIGGPEGPNSVKKNLWHTLLESVGSRHDMPQAHLLILGDKGCGKRSFVKALNKPFLKGNLANKFDEFGSDFANFDASFVYMRDISEPTEGNLGVTDDSS